MIAHCALSGLLVWRFTCFRIFEWRFLHPQQAREAPETGLVLHMVGNFWIDLFLSKNAFSLKLSCAGDIDSDFFIFFFALAFCCRLYYYQLVRNEVQNKKKKKMKTRMKCFDSLIFSAVLWEIPIFQSTLEWNNFCNISSSCERRFKIWPALCWSALLIPLFPVGCAVQLLLWSVVWPGRNH